MRFRLKPVALSVLCAFAPAPSGADEPLYLKLDRTFNVMPETSDATPAFIDALHIEGKQDNQIEAVGDAELRKHGQAIFADRLLYRQDTKEVTADGSVRVEQGLDVLTGPHLEMNLDSNIGDMPQPQFYLGENDSRGNADSLHFAGKKNYSMNNVTYTVCPVGNDDWLLKMSRLDIDRATQIGEAHGAHVEFKGVPILYTPWMDFSLSNNRKTGFLSPIFGGTSTGGSEIALPFYWNIAPNYDATLTPRLMAKRGLLMNNEFRYLQPSYAGEAHVDVLPTDQITKQTRSHLLFKQSQNLGSGFSDSFYYESVSDNAYFRDLSTNVVGTSQVNLLRTGSLAYNGGWWNSRLNVQRFQTLQDPLFPVGIPYRMLPQLTLSGQRSVDKAAVSLSSEFVDFSHPTAVNGQRVVLYPSVSYRLFSDPAYYLTPKFGVHYTSYHLGTNNTAGLPTAPSLALPIFSLDGGMTFERDLTLGKSDLVQTLEPRAYYVYIPYRNQDALPVFDTAQATFNFAQIFTENRFYGNDRVGDANQLTLALTSRFLDAAKGLERLRLIAGQRFSFATPRVNLVAPTVTANKSDVLLGASGRLTKSLSLDSLFQYSPVQSQTNLFNMVLHYRPESGKVLNLGYQFNRAVFNQNGALIQTGVKQVDLSGQWPLYGRWHSVAKWNYSLQDKQLLEGLLGIEYTESCWTVRLVAQRFTVGTLLASTGIFLQLELNDLIRVGSDPLQALRQGVPGYTKLNQMPLNTPVQGLR